jgi:hypothetical protein
LPAPGYISKTAFLKFEQCSKAFFFYKRLPQLVDQPDADKKLVFLRGHEVGKFAQSLFPGGTDASENAPDAAAIVMRTTQLIAQGARTIYEAGFIHENTLVVVDILNKHDEKWIAYEVKSALKVSENYMRDACLQYHVLKKALPDFDDIFLVTINPGYVLQGKVDPRKYFVRRSMKAKAEVNRSYFEMRIAAANLVLEENKIPDIPIGRHCFVPYRCDYFSTCWKAADSALSVFNFPLADRNIMFEWHDAGITEIGDIPDELLRRESLVKIRDAYVSGKPFIDAPRIKAFVAAVRRPVAAIDMEIWSPAIPAIQGARPFEQIPFLFTLFDGANSLSFFSDDAGDGREAFARELIRLTEGFETLLVYDKTLELLVLGDLETRFPAMAGQIRAIKPRIVDLSDVFIKLWYYHPSFRNNFSLKAVSGTLAPDVSYTAIESGLEAMSLYRDFRNSSNELERETLRNALVEYCNTDSFATYRLFEFLSQLVQGMPNDVK